MGMGQETNNSNQYGKIICILMAFGFLNFTVHLPSSAFATMTDDVDRSSSSQRVTIDDLDRVLDEAGSLSNFLASSEIQDQYFRLASQYYGKRFLRNSYEAIIADLQYVVSQNPEIGRLVWERRSTRPTLTFGSSVLQTDAAVFTDRWREYLENELGVVVGADIDAHSLRDDLFKSVQWVSTQLSAIADVASAPGIGAKTKQQYLATQYRNLRQSEMYKVAQRQLFRFMCLSEPYLCKILISDDADKVIYAYEKIRSDLSLRARHLDPLEFDQNTIIFILDRLPKSQTLLSDSKLFFRPEKANSGSISLADVQYESKDLARPFHAIFAGIVCKECAVEGGGLTPRRYLLGTMPGTVVSYFTNGGNYLGYMVHRPVEYFGKHYYSIDNMVSGLEKYVATVDPNTLSFAKSSLFTLWLRAETMRLPEGILGYVVGSSGEIRNAGGLHAIRRSGAWFDSNFLGDAIDFEWNTRFDRAVVDFPLPPKLRDIYVTNQMIFDLSVPDAGGVFLLNPNAADPDPENFQNWLQNQTYASDLHQLARAFVTAFQILKGGKGGDGFATRFFSNRAQTFLEKIFDPETAESSKHQLVLLRFGPALAQALVGLMLLDYPQSIEDFVDIYVYARILDDFLSESLRHGIGLWNFRDQESNEIPFDDFLSPFDRIVSNNIWGDPDLSSMAGSVESRFVSDFTTSVLNVFKKYKSAVPDKRPFIKDYLQNAIAFGKGANTLVSPDFLSSRNDIYLDLIRSPEFDLELFASVVHVLTRVNTIYDRTIWWKVISESKRFDTSDAYQLLVHEFQVTFKSPGGSPASQTKQTNSCGQDLNEN
jgi:hypothetical protein